MTPQEVFDFVVAHLRQQGSKSIKLDEQGKPVFDYDGKTPICMYRSPDGKKCAVGCLITDEEYNPQMETWNVDHVMMMSLSFEKRVYQHSTLLRSLQEVHDAIDVEDWEPALQRVARYWGLQYAPPS